MSMCESILTIALVCTVKYLHYCDYYYTLGNDSQSTPKLIAYYFSYTDTPKIIYGCIISKRESLFITFASSFNIPTLFSQILPHTSRQSLSAYLHIL